MNSELIPHIDDVFFADVDVDVDVDVNVVY